MYDEEFLRQTEQTKHGQTDTCKTLKHFTLAADNEMSVTDKARGNFPCLQLTTAHF